MSIGIERACGKRANHWIMVAFFGACALALSVGCAAPQQDQETATAQASESEDGEEDEKVCRTKRPTGSNIARRVCEDPETATDRRERDQERMRESQRRETGPQ